MKRLMMVVMLCAMAGLAGCDRGERAAQERKQTDNAVKRAERDLNSALSAGQQNREQAERREEAGQR